MRLIIWRTESLATCLQNWKHQNSCHIVGFCTLCAIQKHVSRALQSIGRILAPKDLISNSWCISWNFRMRDRRMHMSIWPTTGNTLAWAMTCERDQWGHAKVGHLWSPAPTIPDHFFTFQSPNPPNYQLLAILSYMLAIHMYNHFNVHVASFYLFPALILSIIGSFQKLWWKFRLCNSKTTCHLIVSSQAHIHVFSTCINNFQNYNFWMIFKTLTSEAPILKFNF